jgi:hypothetical protein
MTAPSVAGPALDQLEGHSRQAHHRPAKGGALKQVRMLLVIRAMAVAGPRFAMYGLVLRR